MIGCLLPPAATALERRDDVDDVALHPGELACVADAVDSRRREFATGRHLARVALGRLGAPPCDIPKGARGAPRWPPGVVGSITHCAGYRAAAVSWARDLAALGIDAEPHGPLPDGVLPLTSVMAERGRLRTLAAAAPGVAWDRVLFSAKESVYKAWYPLTGEFLGFEQVNVEFDECHGSFEAQLLVPGPLVDGVRLRTVPGRFAIVDGIVLTAVAVVRAAVR